VAVNLPHHNLGGVLWQLVAIAVLARAFIVGRRAILTKRFASHGASGVFKTKSERFRQDKDLSSDIYEAHNVAVAAHDEQGRTPVERMFN
jgi:hypothetical protein